MGPETVHGGAAACDLEFMARSEIGIGHAVAVCKGPAVEAPLHHQVELARREIVTEQVATVVRGIELPCAGPPVEADGVPQAAREDLHVRSVGIEAQHRGTSGVLLEANVAARSQGEVKPPVRPKVQGAGPVIPAAREPGHDALEGALGLACRRVESHAPDGVGLGDVEPATIQVHAVGAV